MNQFFNKCFFFLSILWTSACFPRANLTIKDIQIGSEINKTRVVFILNHPTALYVETKIQSPEECSFFIKGPEDTFWQVPEKITTDRGSLIEYKVEGFGSRRGCYMIFKPYTRLVGGFLRGKTYILDLITEDPPLPLESEEEILPEAGPDEIDPPLSPPSVNIKQTLELPQNEINSLMIIPKEDETTWIIINSDKQDFFESQILPESRKLYLYLPKINWPSIETQILNSGSIKSYTVDESVPGASTVVMDIMENATMVDLFSTPNLDGTYDFVLILANRKATEEEVKKLSEKRMEIKSVVSASKSLSFKINPPQLEEAPSLNISQEEGMGEMNAQPLSLSNYEEGQKEKEKESLFDTADFVQTNQEPAWVSEARTQIKEK